MGSAAMTPFAGSVWHPDYFYGGNDEDTVSYSGLGFAPAATIDLEHQALNDGVARGDRFYFVEDIVGTDLGDDTIYGNFANNTFNGGGGRRSPDGPRRGRHADRRPWYGHGSVLRQFCRLPFRTLHFNDGERFLEVHDTHANRDGTDYVIEVEHLEFLLHACCCIC